MRDLIFRSWDGQKMQKAFDLSQNPHYWWKDNHDYPLMQYTGLKDKNGIEIYEGDIVIATWRSSIPVRKIDYTDGVTYSRGAFRIKGDPIYLYEELDVIGNIYENKELLNESN